MNREATDLWERTGRALKTAEDWSQEDPDASVSRSYYAAFYAVSALFVHEVGAFTKHAAAVFHVLAKVIHISDNDTSQAFDVEVR